MKNKGGSPGYEEIQRLYYEKYKEYSKNNKGFDDFEKYLNIYFS
jgi:hypothetical protein